MDNFWRRKYVINDRRARRRRLSLSSRTIVYLYLFVSSLWLIAFDYAPFIFDLDIHPIFLVQRSHEWVFVFLSAYFLHYLINRLTNTIRGQKEALQKDIAKRYQTEATLAEVQKIAHLGSWEWCIDRGTLVWSEEVYRIFGLLPEKFTPTYEKFLSLIPEDERKTVQQLVQLSLGNPRQMFKIEHSILRPDGSLRSVMEYGKVVFDDDGKPLRMIGTVQDITERKQMEQQVMEIGDQYRSLAEAAKDAIITADADGNILSWNHGAQICFGYSPQEVIGQSLTILMPPQFRSLHQRGMEKVRESKALKLRGQVVELRGLRKNGQEFPLEVSLATWEVAKKPFFSGIIRDITLRKRLEEEQDQAYRVRLTISSLLETALEPLSLELQLEVTLDILHTLPWLAKQQQGSIFLADEASQELVLVAHRGMPSNIVKSCQRVAFGHCLCGRAAKTQELLFADDHSQEHEIQFEGMKPHSHYCVPIMFAKRLLGVLNIYLPAGHIRNADEESILQTIVHTLATIIERRRMESVLQATHEKLRETRLEIIRRLGMAAEYRDNETGLHVIRMSKYAVLLAKSIGLSELQCEILLNAAPMHDVGKIGVSDTILLKKARLIAEEFEIMKKHTVIGADMLYGHNEEPLNTAHLIALTHHEKWDGSGYPYGLKGKEIPLVGHICAIADVFDALTSERPYKKSWSVEEAMAELERSSGTHFDPDLVGHFRAILPEIIKIKEQLTDMTTQETWKSGDFESR
ncbi:MAG: PAS domain S-box protein [Magnetococcus sp. DMHC-6]